MRLYYQFNLEALVPPDHLLRRIDQAIDWSFVRPCVAGCYGTNGNPSEDPIVILKLLLLAHLYKLRSERELMRDLPLRLDWLWFAGFDIDELDRIPDHSVLCKSRKLWGKELFTQLFMHVVDACVQANLVDGHNVCVDSSTNAANASMDSLKTCLRVAGQRLYDELDHQQEAESRPSESQSRDPEACRRPQAACQAPGQAESSESTPTLSHAAEPVLDPVASVIDPAERSPDPVEPALAPTERVAEPRLGSRLSTTDPDARLSKKNGKTTLGYKDHRAIDHRCGIITATLTTAADVDDASMLIGVLEFHERTLDQPVRLVVADKGYGTAENYRDLHRRGTTPCIPHKKAREDPDKFPRSAFVHDPSTDTYGCPAGRTLHHRGGRYHAGAQVCGACELRSLCTNSVAHGRKLRRHPLQEEIDKADATFSREHRRRLLGRRQTLAEGSFADAANNHGSKRHRWRGLTGAAIQNLLIATAQNLRKLVRRRMRPDKPYGRPARTLRCVPGRRDRFFVTSPRQHRPARRPRFIRRR